MQADGTIEVLVSVRDYLRYAITRFNAAGLTYGHGTDNALDEAAYLILHALSLPIDQLEPWLDARLTIAERRGILDAIERRISTRKPAPYLTNEAWIRGHAFYVDERVIVPRSFIGELLAEPFPALIPDPAQVGRILDLCTGSGCLAILAAETFPFARIDASDVSADALAVARINVDTYQLEDRIELIKSDVFGGLHGRRYDLILTNPPYVTAEAVAGFPPEYAAEPQLAHAGGEDGLDIVHRILSQAAEHLNSEGILIMEVGNARPLLEEQYPRLPFLWLDTAESEGEVFALSAAELRAGSPRAT